jgi:hypothetical protein
LQSLSNDAKVIPHFSEQIDCCKFWVGFPVPIGGFGWHGRAGMLLSKVLELGSAGLMR